MEQVSTLRGPDDRPIDVTVGDLSVSGCNVRSSTVLPVGAVVQLGLPGTGRFAARVVRRDGDQYGCEFFEYLSDAAVLQSFGTDNVAQLFVAAPDWHGAAPVVDKWPRAIRVSLAVAGSLVLWAAILWIVLR
jgi:hypothetical protein